MQKEWYYKKNDLILRPITLQEISLLVKDEKIAADDLVKCGTGNWITAWMVPEINFSVNTNASMAEFVGRFS